MAAKKTAAPKRPAQKSAKIAKAKTVARKPAPKKAAAKPQPKVAVKAPVKSPLVAAERPAAKQAAISKQVPKPAAPIGVIKGIAAPAAKKAAAAASKSKPSASTSFDPDRRRELIAAAAARHRKPTPTKAPITPIVIAPRQVPTVIERHRFSVGDEVRVVSTSGMWFKHGVDYRITAALPPQSGKLQYRIKNDQEPFERVVSELQLANAPAQI